MTDAFIAFVRHEEELLLLRRSKSDSDSPALWDGVYGIGDNEEDVLNRVAECTGIPLEDLEYVRAGPALGIDCLLYTSPSPRDQRGSRMPSSA